MAGSGRSRAHVPLGRAVVASSAALLLVAFGGARAAHAQSAEAERLFHDGARLMAEGDHAKACDAFEASNRIEPTAGTLLRLGDCREKNRQYASAWSAFSDALARAQDPEKRKIAEANLAALAPRLSHLTIDVPDGSRLADLVITRDGRVLDAALWNRAAPLDGGDYEIAARAAGHEAWTTRVAVADERAQIVVTVPRLRPLTPGASGAVGPRETPRRLTTRRTVALGLAGAGVVFVIVGAVNGWQVNELEGRAHDLCGTADDVCADFVEANEHLEDARGKARLANVGFGLAAVSVAGAAVLWVTGRAPAERGVGVAPSVGSGVAGAVVRGTF